MSAAYLYVIRLDDAVLDKKKFMDRNPHYRRGKPCYYVGASVYPPAERFRKHKAGERSSRWVRIYGLYVVKGKCRRIDVEDTSQRDAAERAYARELRDKGYGVWQN